MNTKDFEDREEREKRTASVIALVLNDFYSVHKTELTRLSRSDWDELHSSLVNKISPELSKTAYASAKQLQQEAGVEINARELRAEIDSWVKKRANELADQVVQTTKDSLDSFDVNADDFDARAEKLFNNARASTIGITETTGAIVNGISLAMMAAGLSIKNAMWHTAADDLVCEQCEPLDGLPATDEPPLHPNCRCWIGYEMAKKEYRSKTMPKGSWTPPESGDAPAEVKRILKSAYAAFRDKHPGENPATKAKGAKIAWGAVKNAGWHKNKEGKWTKKMSKEYAMIQAKDFPIFKVGTWNGENYTEADLDNMVKSYNADEPIPIIVGHSSDYKGHTRIPAFGRILGGLKRIGQDLIACGVEFNDKLANWIREGFYNQRSIELTRDNKRVLAVGMLGAVPPAVTGLPANDESLNEIALQFSSMQEAKVIEFQSSAIDFEEIKNLANEDTNKNIEECFAMCAKEIQNHLESEDDPDECKQECMSALMDCFQEISEEINEHFTFSEKLEDLEPEETKTMMAKIKEWLHISQSTKESDMDEKKEKQYQAQIAELDTQVKEFTEKERLATEAKTKTEAEAKEISRVVVEQAQQSEVKIFCDTAIKENRMTPAMRETDEKIMFDLAKVSPEVLKSFQQKYTTLIVPLGITKEIDVQDSNDKRPQVMVKAEKYTKDHPKEFVGLTTTDAINRAVYLHSMGQIKFEGDH